MTNLLFSLELEGAESDSTRALEWVTSSSKLGAGLLSVVEIIWQSIHTRLLKHARSLPPQLEVLSVMISIDSPALKKALSCAQAPLHESSKTGFHWYCRPAPCRNVPEGADNDICILEHRFCSSSANNELLPCELPPSACNTHQLRPLFRAHLHSLIIIIRRAKSLVAGPNISAPQISMTKSRN